MTDQAKLVEDLRTYPWGVDDTPEGPRLLKRAADLLASKDGELKASEIMRNLLSANLERRTEALVAAEALTLSLRAENERLKELAAWAAKQLSEWDEYQKRPESGDWGVECACCMGEMFDTEDREKIAQLASLSQSTGDTK